jgi:hypothetical protein
MSRAKPSLPSDFPSAPPRQGAPGFDEFAVVATGGAMLVGRFLAFRGIALV